SSDLALGIDRQGLGPGVDRPLVLSVVVEGGGPGQEVLKFFVVDHDFPMRDRRAPQRHNLCPAGGKSNAWGPGRYPEPGGAQEPLGGAAPAFLRASLSTGRSLKPGLYCSTLAKASEAVLRSFLPDRETIPRFSQVCQWSGPYWSDVRNCAIASSAMPISYRQIPMSVRASTSCGLMASAFL